MFDRHSHNRAKLRKELDLKTVFTALVAGIVGGLIAASVVYLGFSGPGGGSEDATVNEQVPTASVNPGGEEGPSVGEVYTRDGPGVVSVDVNLREIGPGGGSGFVIDEEGHVVTNQHVVSGAENLSVRFSNGAREEAEVVGEDPSTDTAVLKVDAPEEALKPLPLGDSDSVGVGDPVIAIGNPLDVGVSVTTGIVSGLGRPIPAPNRYTINGAIQTDAAISSGNSGGPLLDARGTVIGVTSQVRGGAEPLVVAQGVGFAVPINTVKGVTEQLIETGEVEHGYIGVRMFREGIEHLAAYSGQSAQELSEEYGLPESGAIVSQVTEGGPAEGAGLKSGEREEEIAGLRVPIGDVITEVEGDSVSTPDDVIETVNSLRPGDSLDLTVVTPGEKSREVTVRLGIRPDEQ
jgi:S1-C subfamily serine protease